MLERTGVELPPPQYLDQVEQAIGVRFFAHDAANTLARTAPSQLGPERLATYGELYMNGLHLLAAARRQFQLPRDAPLELTPTQIKLFRRRHSDSVENLRDRLSAASPVVSEGSFRDTVTQAALKTELGIGQTMIDDMMCDNGLLYLTFRRSRKTRIGMLHHTEADAERIRELAAAITVAGEDDVQFTPLMRELGSTPPRLRAVMEALGVTAVEKRIVEHGRLASYFTPEDADLLRAHFAGREDHAGFLTITQIAEAAEVSTNVVRKQIAWRQFDQHIQTLRQRLTEDSRLSTAFYLPEEYANQIIAELRVIVPDEYLTIGEYSELRGLNHSNVRHAITRLGLATHDYTQREKTIAYLDGATMYRLDQVLEAAQVAPVGWRTMKEIEALVDATDITIAKELKGDFAEGAVRRLKPRDSDGGAIPHYSPEFVAHVKSVIKPKVAPENHTSLQDLVIQTGMTNTGLVFALRRSGIPPVQTRSAANGNVVNYYPNDQLEGFLAKLPPRIIPEGGVSLTDVAFAMGCSVEAARQRLRTRGIKSRRYWSVATNGMSGYYMSDELSAAGIQMPDVLQQQQKPATVEAPDRSWTPTGRLEAPVDLQRQYTEADIQAITGASSAAVRLAAQATLAAGALTRRNASGSLVFSGQGLGEILSQIVGVPLRRIVRETNLPEKVVASFLQKENFTRTPNGTYSPDALIGARSRLRRAPPGWVALDNLTQEYGIDAAKHATAHGSKSELFYDSDGQRRQYIDPLGSRIVRAQYASTDESGVRWQSPPAGFAHRYQIAELAGRTPDEVDLWLLDQARTTRQPQIFFCSVADPPAAQDARVLPHYPVSFFAPFIIKSRRGR